MSVSLRVHFDRADRTYGVGEPVTGRVLIETDRGAECLGVTLTHMWRAHGLGNADWNPKPKVYTLRDGPLPDLPKHEIRFAFPAPKDPLTYQGKQFEIEHSLQVGFGLPISRVSLQEAADATVTEGFNVVSGPLGEPPPKDLLRAVSLATATRHYSWATPATRSGAVSPDALQVLSSTLESAAKARRWAAEHRIGPVLAYLSSRVVSPGEILRVNLRFGPTAPVKINGAFLELRGQEISTFLRVGGPDVSRKAREIKEETLFSTVRRITGPLHLRPENPVVFRSQVEVPVTNAYSFVSDHHQVVWEAVVRVDVPAWPDWTRAFPLIVWPELSEEPVRREVSDEVVSPELSEQSPEDVEGVDEPPTEVWLPWEEATEFAATEGILGGEGRPPVEEDEKTDLVSEIRGLWAGADVEVEGEPAEAIRQPEATGAPERIEPLEQIGAPERIEPLEARADPIAPEGSGPSLAERVDAIREENIIGGDRDGLIKALIGQTFSFRITVGRIEQTMSMFSHPDYGRGRTISGTVADTGVEVAVCFPKVLNEEVDSLDQGSSYPVRGTVSGWDGLRRRPTISAELQGNQ